MTEINLNLLSDSLFPGDKKGRGLNSMLKFLLGSSSLPSRNLFSSFFSQDGVGMMEKFRDPRGTGEGMCNQQVVFLYWTLLFYSWGMTPLRLEASASILPTSALSVSVAGVICCPLSQHGQSMVTAPGSEVISPWENSNQGASSMRRPSSEQN